jgi:hypothetical protein
VELISENENKELLELEIIGNLVMFEEINKNNCHKDENINK